MGGLKRLLTTHIFWSTNVCSLPTLVVTPKCALFYIQPQALCGIVFTVNTHTLLPLWASVLEDVGLSQYVNTYIEYIQSVNYK